MENIIVSENCGDSVETMRQNQENRKNRIEKESETSLLEYQNKKEKTVGEDEDSGRDLEKIKLEEAEKERGNNIDNVV